MWSVEKRRKNDAEQGEPGETAPPQTGAGPVAEGALAPNVESHERPTEEYSELPQPLTPVESFGVEHETWRDQLRRTGGTSALLHFDDHAHNRIELSTTHPGGLPQFISGNRILLSQLIRDDLAFRQARRAAARVTDKAIEMRTVRGLETVHLAIGITQWHFEGEEFCAPVLLRPLAIRRYGRDFELKLKQRPFVNPELVRILQEQFGVRIDSASLLELSQTSGVFKPQPVIDRLRQITSGIAEFTVQPRLLVSTFLDVGRRMAADATELDHDILDAICGSEIARERIHQSYRPVTATPVNERSPETDHHLYDADPEQEDVLAQIEAGHSVVVRTLPGTGGSQTVVNAIGSLTRAGKRVLVVSPRRATLDGINHRLSRVGLAGLATSPRLLRRNLVESIARNEKVKPGNTREVDDALVRLRTVLLNYQQALIAKDQRFGVSPVEALHALTRLTHENQKPTTTVRLSDAALAGLALDRSSVAESLTEIARLGQFEYGPEDSPWYGVSFKTTEEARNAYALAVELAETELPRLMSMAEDVIAQTSMRPYESIAELGIYLRLLTGVRETLDRFTPEVYDRSLTEVIAAHAPRGGDEISGANRRRLRKLAKEYVRPGVSVTDMYSRLVQIQQQRVLWQRYSTIVGAPPQVPVGISDLVVAFQKAYQDLDKLDQILAIENDAERLRNLPLPELAELMTGLARESEVLKNIQERTALIETLRDAHLEPLLDDLSVRHVPAEQVSNELEQAWWQSALERMLQENKALLSANTGVIERLESDFRLVDDAHMSANGATLASKLADIWRVAVLDHPAEAHALRDALRSGVSSLTYLSTQAPNLLRALTPVWAVSPYEVPALPPEMRFDTVLIVDASAVALAELLGAIRRARQVVAFGDPVVQHPSPFEIAVRVPDDDASDGEEEAFRQSAFEQLGTVLPELTLTQSYRAGGADLTELVNSRFYDSSISSMPWAGTFLGHRTIKHDFVEDGQGLPDPQTGAVESTDGEVARVVQLVLQHASEHPRESLMVITVSEKHAVRVQQAVLKAFAKFPEYRDFLLGDRAEPFAVLTLEQATAQSRDRVIFSVGFGRTPHGRVLSNFGSLSRPGGERHIAIAMTRARRAMTIVSCFKPEDLDGARIKHGVVELLEVLTTEPREPEIETIPGEDDPMIAELAERLEGLGLKVVLDYQGVVPLAASYEDRAVAIDFDADITQDRLRDALRLRPAVLRRLGWHYQRVHSFDLFADPAEVALRIARTLGYDAEVEAAVAEGR